MNAIPRQAIGDPAAWRGPRLRGYPAWIHRLSAVEIADLDAALAAARAAGRTVATLRREDFPLGALAEAVHGWARALDRGRSLVLVRGLPVERWGADEAALAYSGVEALRRGGIPKK